MANIHIHKCEFQSFVRHLSQFFKILHPSDLINHIIIMPLNIVTIIILHAVVYRNGNFYGSIWA